MIWMTWRQFRVQAIAVGALIAVVGVVLLVSGLSLASAYNSADLNGCHASCATAASNFLGTLRGSSYVMLFYGGIGILYLAPALIGAFWGAPLIARELETGTYRLSWNQSITRSRWAAAKLGLVGLAAMAATGLLSLMISWWASPIDDALTVGSNSDVPLTFSRIGPVLFAARGIAPIGYAAFAFALGVTLGVVFRRTLPAMALTLALFAVVQFAVPNFVRPHLIPPEQVTAPLNVNTVSLDMSQARGGPITMTVTGPPFAGPDSWILANDSITPAGRVFTGPGNPVCQRASPRQCGGWLASLHLRQRITYQPASRFWPLQWLETGIYLVLAAGLGMLCAWQVRRKRA